MEEERPVLEKNGARVAKMGVGVLLSCGVLAGIVFGLDRMVDRRLRTEIQVRQLDPESVALRKLRAEEQGKLGHYQWIDRNQGVVRIPVERAMELILKERETVSPPALSPPAPTLSPPAPTLSPPAPTLSPPAARAPLPR